MVIRKPATVLSARGQGYTVACLPYRTQSPSSPSMYFTGYLPDPRNTVKNVLARLPDGHGPLRETRYSRFGLPRFEIETSLSLFPLLDQLGYPVREDSSRMGGPGPNLVSEVVHKTKITVDEKGTRAAAATAIVMSRGGGGATPPDLIFDRPFVFSITDDAGLEFLAGMYSLRV